MSVVRRLTIVVFVTALLCGLAYGVGAASEAGHLPWQGPLENATPVADRPGAEVPADLPRTDAPDGSAGHPTDEPAEKPEKQPTEPQLVPGPALLAPGDSGDDVRRLQARLAQIDWFEADVTGFYGEVTEEAVRGFQDKREIPVTGEVDRRTLNRLHAMTTEPTEAELTGIQSHTNDPGALDPRCLEGRVLCIDKTSRTLRWVVDGTVQKAVDVRFGGEFTPTREGVFSVFQKSRDHVSSLYHTPMPFALFFSGGQAVHYSPDFAAVGYDGASHGCVNVRDRAGIAWLYDQVQIGDAVVVYWS